MLAICVRNRHYIGAIVRCAKYIPEFKDAMGDAAFKIYHKVTTKQIKKGEAAHIEKTRTTRVVPLKKFLERLETAKTKLGETSPEYVLAELHVKLKGGMRGELGSVKVVDSDNNPSLRTTPNYYSRYSGRLVIRRFKTREEGYDPYEFTLPAELNAIVDNYLASRRNPRYLIRDKATSSSDIGHVMHNAIGVKINGYATPSSSTCSGKTIAKLTPARSLRFSNTNGKQLCGISRKK